MRSSVIAEEFNIARLAGFTSLKLRHNSSPLASSSVSGMTVTRLDSQSISITSPFSDDALFSEGALIASGGYLLAFPLASALVAEGLDRSRNAGLADFKAQLICWFTAMIPVYLFGTLWLASAYSVDFAQAFEWGVEPFLIWDAAKIVFMAMITTNVWAYSQPEQ